MKATIIVILSCCTLCCDKAIAQPANSQIEDLSHIFESRYQAWKKASPQHTIRSDTSLPADIIRLGTPAVPFLFEKLSENPHEKGIVGAIWIITKKRWDKSEWPEGMIGNTHIEVEMYLKWWREEHTKAGEIFEQTYARWKKLRKDSKSESADAIWQQMKNMGVDALPFVVEGIREGDTGLIPIISQILRKNVVGEDATIGEVMKWWQRNELKLRIPSTKEEAKEIYQKLQNTKLVKKTAKVPSNTPSPESELDTSQKQMPTGWILPIVIVGAVVIAGVVIFLLLRRKK